ncbi:MAG: hypothetical protein Q4P32_13110, partial [Micrococcales bacterium]|nr:hypothetical protein [Micrococcales bacterium]
LLFSRDVRPADDLLSAAAFEPGQVRVGVARWKVRSWRTALARQKAARAAGGREDDVLRLIEAVGAALSAGLAPADALVAVAESRSATVGRGRDATPIDEALPTLVLRAHTGEHLSPAWRDFAESTGSPEVLLLARAWGLSEASGAPLAAAAQTAAGLLREDRDRRRSTAGAVAGARTTMTILTLLPLGGPPLAMVMGLDLGRLYLSSPMVWACLLIGATLVVVGRVWVARLVVAATRGPELK